ncbi:MAG: hypothetical protein U5K79_24185 [Cyclobacteriaceae bacterium]|nr:hypothetical protein [Cyclobacteriaceae bacterium]
MNGGVRDISQTYFLTKRTEFTIIGNDFQSPAGVTSIYINDLLRTLKSDYEYPQLFDIKSNTFNTREGGTAIMGLNNVDAKIWNNTFKGTGAVGVYLEGDAASGTYAENNKVLTNNFKQAAYSNANVYLGEYTRNCVVQGVATDKVSDNGVDNKVIGTKANKMGPHFKPGDERESTPHESSCQIRTLNITRNQQSVLIRPLHVLRSGFFYLCLFV